MIARRPVSLSWQNVTCSWPRAKMGCAWVYIQEGDVEVDDDEMNTMAAPDVEPLRGRRAVSAYAGPDVERVRP